MGIYRRFQARRLAAYPPLQIRTGCWSVSTMGGTRKGRFKMPPYIIARRCLKFPRLTDLLFSPKMWAHSVLTNICEDQMRPIALSFRRTRTINRSHAVYACMFLAFLGVSFIKPTPVMAQSCPALEARLEVLEELTSRMQLVQIDGHWAYVFGLPDEGVNMYVQNGMGMTACANGLGNLIVGYNEERPTEANNRT